MLLKSLSSLMGVLLVASVLCGGGCSFMVDASPLDEGCDPEQEKECSDRCVSLDDPGFGCGTTGCEPCELENAVPRCEESRCVVDTCLDGFGCPTADGCNVNLLLDPLNCGACEHECPEGQVCLAGVCGNP